MTKEIYIDKLSGHINQRLANFVSDKQILTWDKNNLYKYKKIYPMSKTQIFFKFDFFVPKQLIQSIKVKISLINNQKQQSFILGSANVICDPANSYDSISTYPIQVPMAQVLLIQVSLA